MYTHNSIQVPATLFTEHASILVKIINVVTETQQHNTFYYQTIPTQTCHYEQTQLNQRKHIIYKLERKINKK
jgi:hypothetical protein